MNHSPKKGGTKMKKLSKLIMVSIISLIAVGLVSTNALAEENLWKAIQEKGVLKVGGAAATPYQMRNPKTGQWEGVYIEIMQMLADELKVKLEVIDTTWDNLVSGLITGKWDIAPALNRTVPRSLVVNYSISAHDYQIGFVFNKNNPKINKSWKSIQDFDKEGIVFALKGGTAEEKALSDQIKNATISRFPGQDEFRLAVATGRADIAVDDADPNSIFAMEHKDWSMLVVPEPSITKQGVAFGFRKSVGLDEIQTLNILIEQLIAKGWVEKRFEDYFEQAAKEK
jgi:polar amino acid transport system substrate-binding protein